MGSEKEGIEYNEGFQEKLQQRSERKWKSFSPVLLFAIPQTVACQAPLSIEFSRQEYWSG